MEQRVPSSTLKVVASIQEQWIRMLSLFTQFVHHRHHPGVAADALFTFLAQFCGWRNFVETYTKVKKKLGILEKRVFKLTDRGSH
jgi:hypothetical protein